MKFRENCARKYCLRGKLHQVEENVISVFLQQNPYMKQKPKHGRSEPRAIHGGCLGPLLVRRCRRGCRRNARAP